MVKIHCVTNLDIRESWPDSLPERPVIGDIIMSTTTHKTTHGTPVNIRLKVVATAWEYEDTEDGDYVYRDWYLKVELHDPLKRSIRDFYKWYAPLIGKTVDSFI